MTKEIVLNNGHVALVDDDDFEYLSQFKWKEVPNGYAYRAVYFGRREHISPDGKWRQRERKISMAREVMKTPDGFQVDHINHNRLDNRKSNLRNVSSQQNNMNKPVSKLNRNGFKGVSARSKKWKAQIYLNGKMIYLGVFELIEDAARAYDDAARKYFGEFAFTNF